MRQWTSRTLSSDTLPHRASNDTQGGTGHFMKTYARMLTPLTVLHARQWHVITYLKPDLETGLFHHRVHGNVPLTELSEGRIYIVSFFTSSPPSEYNQPPVKNVTINNGRISLFSFTPHRKHELWFLLLLAILFYSMRMGCFLICFTSIPRWFFICQFFCYILTLWRVLYCMLPLCTLQVANLTVKT